MAEFATVLVGTDFSPCAEMALDAVRRLAPRLGTRRVHVVTVVQTSAWVTPPMVAAADLTEAAFDEGQRRLEALELDLPDVHVTKEARLGSAPRELAAAARERHADLVVVATHGRTGLTRAVLGSVTSSLVRVADVPVLVVPAEGYIPSSFDRILAAVDLSPVSRPVLDAAGAFARTSGEPRIRVLSTFEHPLLGSSEGELLPHYASKEEIEALGEQHREEVDRLARSAHLEGVPVDVEVMSKAPPFRVILDVAELTEADLIVVGTSGRNAWHRMIVGSTATRVLNGARRPVLVIPHEVQQEVPEGQKLRRPSPGHTPLPADG
jgi:nucleotide-binding universal stress UspA family protein